MTRTQRVWQIINLLTEQPYQVQELADQFCVSPKTIYADLLLLRGAPFFLDVRRIMAYWVEKNSPKNPD